MIREAQTVFCLTRLERPQNGDFSKAICTLPGIDFCSNWLMPGKLKMKSHQALSPTHPWLWRAVSEARPTEGDGPDAGGSAFFDRMKNEGMLRKTHSCLSKTAQSPAYAKASAGKKDCLFLWYFLLGKQKKVQMPGYSDQPGQKGTDLRASVRACGPQ
jgi:hypothetical protein